MDRTKGLGGTDIAAIAGLNPWKSPIDVYMEKLGLTEPQEENEAMWWGKEMEPILQKRYEQETGFRVYEPNIFQHFDYDWYVGTPDGIVPPDGGVDYKTTGYADKDEWGEPGSDDVPVYYHTQAMWYMGLTGAKWWDVAVLIMGRRREFRIYRVNRDEELIAALIEKGKDFWENHVLKQIPPPVDASPGWGKFFKVKYPKEEEDFIETSGFEQTNQYIHIYHKAKDQLMEAQKFVAEYENKLKEIIGPHAGIKSDFCKITWKKSKDRTVVDWEKAFIGLAKLACFKSVDTNTAQLFIKHNTIIIPGPRVFKAYFKEKG